MSKMMGRGALAILAPLYEDVSHAGAIVSVQHDALSGHWAQHPAPYIRYLLVMRCYSMMDIVVGTRFHSVVLSNVRYTCGRNRART